jgi:hypothetical protein
MTESRQRLVAFVDLRMKCSFKLKIQIKIYDFQIFFFLERIQFVSDQAMALESTFLDEKKKGVEHTIRLCLLWLSSREIQLASFFQ